MQALKLLIAEQNHTDCLRMEHRLKSTYEIVTSSDGIDAMRNWEKHKLSAAIISLDLEKINGLKLIEKIRKTNTKIPIVAISSGKDLGAHITAYHLGADMVVARPINPAELVCRLTVFTRRIYPQIKEQEEKAKKVFEFGGKKYDAHQMLIIYEASEDNTESEIIKLTTRENELLLFLLGHPNQIVKRSEVLESIWGKDDYFNGRSMDVMITTLRKHFRIENKYGVGFSFPLPQ